MKSERRRSGIGLLDGITVFLIVCGMVFAIRPVFLGARDAQADACKSNLKLIGLGLIQYVQDYDEKWPGGGGHWAGDIYPYMKNPRDYKCPRDNVTFPNGDRVSYALNINLQGAHGGNSMAALSSPARTVAAIEYDGTPAITNWAMDTVSKATTGKGKNTAWGNAVLGRDPPTGALRHDPYINILQCDGHVQPYLASQVSSGRDAAALNAAQTVGGAAGTDALGSDFTITFSEL